MDLTSNLLLEETFYPLSNKNVIYKVRVTNKELILNRINGYSSKTETISLNDIIGCRCTRKKRSANEVCICHPISNRKMHQTVADGENQTINSYNFNGKIDVTAYLHIYAYVMRNFMIKNGKKRERYTITLTFRSYKSYDENMREAQKWKRTVRQLIATPIYPSIFPPQGSDSTNSEVDNFSGSDTIMIILNPKSGIGKSREIFQQKVLPLLVEADLDYELYVTKNQNDARNFVKNSNIFKWVRGIIIIGGDGVLYEAVNGVMERPDWKNVLENITFGIIPAGSGNGLAKSLSHLNKEPYDENPVLVSCLNIIRGSAIPVDLVRIETFSEVVYSFLSVGWGLLADIDIESERLRTIGSQRFTVYSIARLIGLRRYPGRLSFVRIPKEKLKYLLQDVIDDDDEGKECPEDELPVDECAEADARSNRSADMHSILGDIPPKPVNKTERARKESFYSIMSQKSDYQSVGKASSYQSLPDATKGNKKNIYGPPSLLPPLHQPVPRSWEVYQGDFVLVHAVYQSHISEDVIFAPKGKPRDGIIWMVVIRAGISRSNLLQFLLGLSSGTHLNIPNVEMIPVLAFRLEPFSKGSHIVVDGEVIEHSPFQAEIYPAMMSIFTRSS